jgi:uncharacterized lipoprotein YddW (UPF0748 family)
MYNYICSKTHLNGGKQPLIFVFTLIILALSLSMTPAVADDDAASVKLDSPEFRSLWVTRWDFSSQADVEKIMNRAKEANFNAVIFQVRGTFDAYYISAYEPWAERLTGKLGENPGWDPLGVAVQMAHDRGLELHAWINAFPLWPGKADPPIDSQPRHAMYSHPEWVVVDEEGVRVTRSSGYITASPGIPEVQDRIYNVAVDIVRKYDIDGLHFDYIRYLSPEYSHDPVSEKRYSETIMSAGGGEAMSYGDWQREQINNMLTRIYHRVTTPVGIKPELKVSASVFGIYENKWGWKSNNSYHNMYQDSFRWAKDGIVDILFPMIYWDIANPPKFDVLVDDFMANMGSRVLAPGIVAEYDSFDEIRNQVEYCRKKGTIGVALFAYSAIEERDYWDDFTRTVFKHPAPVPELKWK